MSRPEPLEATTRRREFVCLGAAALTCPLSAKAQKRSGIPRIGILWHAGSAEEEAVLLKAFVSNLTRVALLVNPSDKDNAGKYVEEAEAAGSKLGLIVQPVEIGTAADLAPAFSKMRDKVNGVVGTQDGLFYVERKSIA